MHRDSASLGSRNGKPPRHHWALISLLTVGLSFSAACGGGGGGGGDAGSGGDGGAAGSAGSGGAGGSSGSGGTGGSAGSGGTGGSAGSGGTGGSAGAGGAGGSGGAPDAGAPDAGPAQSEHFGNFIIAPGGNVATSENFTLVGTVGEQPGGNRTMISANNRLNLGFVGATQ